jgi:hypothetical protein
LQQKKKSRLQQKNKADCNRKTKQIATEKQSRLQQKNKADCNRKTKKIATENKADFNRKTKQLCTLPQLSHGYYTGAFPVRLSALLQRVSEIFLSFDEKIFRATVAKTQRKGCSIQS